VRSEKRRELCTDAHENYVLRSVRRDELSRSEMRDATAISYEPVEKKRATQTRKSF